MISTQEMIEAALRFEALKDESYEPRGIFNSEMALVLGLCDKLGIEVVVESGRARGQSTYLLAKYLPNVQVYSVERTFGPDEVFARQRLSGLNNVHLWNGDGLYVVPQIVRDEVEAGHKIAVLLDGPKGHPALDVLAEVRSQIAVGFIHDMRKIDHDQPASFRAEAEKRGAWFTDDQDYVAASMHLDVPVWRIGEASKCLPYFIEGNYTGSYGPTLGVFL